MRALDLFCSAGGASVGLHRAGFDVVGVDRAAQPHYPYTFIHTDVRNVRITDSIDFVWASPMCQAHSLAAKRWPTERENQIPWVRELLQAWGGPYIIENVVGAPLRSPVRLCGVMFGLRVFRHRLFESNLHLFGMPHQKHPGGIGFGPADYVTPAGHGGDGPNRASAWALAMGIDWMDKYELSQAIPPAYSEFLGRQVIEQLRRAA